MKNYLKEYIKRNKKTITKTKNSQSFEIKLFQLKEETKKKKIYIKN